jgi:hypothetical protein
LTQHDYKTKSRQDKDIAINMPYVSANGTVGGRKSIYRTIADFFQGIVDFIALIFTSITNPPQRLEQGSTYAQRNNGRAYRSGGRGTGSGGSRANIRGVKNLQGPCDAKMGG